MDISSTSLSSCKSKNQQRKLANYVRRRALVKARRKLKKCVHLANVRGTDAYRSRKEWRHGAAERVTNARETAPNVAVDMSHVCRLSEKEKSRLCAQLCRLYGANKASAKPLNLYLTNFDKDSDFYRMCVTKINGFEHFLMTISAECHTELWPRNEMVYLSPDAADTYTDGDNLCPHRTYIIGALVDETVQKGVSVSMAASQGIVARRFPIRELMTHGNRGTFNPILTLNQVFEVLLRVYETGGDWTTALAITLPPRKGFVPKKRLETADISADDAPSAVDNSDAR